jgi:hypothetical protein
MKIDVDYRLANNSGNITSFKDDEILHLPAIGESIELNQCDLSASSKSRVSGDRSNFQTARPISLNWKTRGTHNDFEVEFIAR